MRKHRLGTTRCRLAFTRQGKKKASFKDYTWNTGEHTASINIDHPGTYTLAVKDQYGCAGQDSILVSIKDCAKGVFFPNAFTPNSNGVNDVFRPVVSGSLSNYTFRIYNRYGQLIFFTTDYSKGWDGKINGKPQDAGVYVWQCSWQFLNGKREFQKGVCTLIK